jgi:uncharacterized membrane protein YfhO
VETLENPATPAAETRWVHPDTLEVKAETAAGQALALQVAYDPSWHAREGGQEYKVSEDALGQTRIDLPPGRHTIELHFDTPVENQVGRGISLAALALAGWLLARKGR